MDYLKEKCVFAGSFDPVTNGHMHIIGMCAMMFNEVIVAIGVNDEKKYTFPLSERLSMLKKACERYSTVKVCYFDGMVADFMKQENCKYYVRGIRDQKDVEYEEKNFKITSKLNPFVELVFFNCPKELSKVSSTMVKECLKQGKPVDKYVPYQIKEMLEEYTKDKKLL